MKNVAKDSRCFELRTYTVREGSSIDLLHSRFRDHTNRLFKKHGMTLVGFWQPAARPDQLIYLLAYKDAAARDAAWAAFGADPEWVKVRTEMAVQLQVDNVFMSATDYSPMKSRSPPIKETAQGAATSRNHTKCSFVRQARTADLHDGHLTVPPARRCHRSVQSPAALPANASSFAPGQKSRIRWVRLV
jgi:hypothetical protein